MFGNWRDREIAGAASISFECVFKLLHDLDARNLIARYVSGLLTLAHKRVRRNMTKLRELHYKLVRILYRS